MSLLGSHVSLDKTLHKSLVYSLSQGVTNPQFFFGNPYQLKRRNFADADIIQCCGLQCNCFVHCPYVVNLAGVASTNSIAWNGENDIDLKVCESICSVQADLSSLDKLPFTKKGCVVHVGSIGKNKDWETGCKAVATSINHLEFSSTPLLIETMVGRGGVLGKNFTELALMYDKIQEKDKVGFCLDTCHIFAEGLFDLGTIAGIDACFSEWDKTIGLNKLKCVHLNDSLMEYGSKKDRHQRIGLGYIWKDREDALNYFLQRCNALDLPFILETCEEDVPVLRETVEKLKQF